MYRAMILRWALVLVPAVICAFLLPAGAAGAAATVRYPHCGSGVSETHVVATYKMERAPVGSHKYRTSTLYCGIPGSKGFGFRHLEPHIGQYFGGWGAFNFSITQTQHTPASITFRESNDTYTRSGPIYQCFPDHHIIWTFNVTTSGDKGARIITAFGSSPKTVKGPCPRSTGRAYIGITG